MTKYYHEQFVNIMAKIFNIIQLQFENPGYLKVKQFFVVAVSVTEAFNRTHFGSRP